MNNYFAPTKFTLAKDASVDLLWQRILDVLPSNLAQEASRVNSSFEEILGFSKEFIVNRADESTIAFVTLSEIRGDYADWSIYMEIN